MKARSLLGSILITLQVGLLASASLADDAGAKLDPSLPYLARRDHAVTHDVDFSVVVTPPYRCKLLKVWLPLPQSDFAQQLIGASELSTFSQKVTPKIGVEPIYGNKFAYFEFDHLQGAQIVRHKFKAKLWDLHWDVAPEKVRGVKEWPSTFAPYLKPQPIKNDKDFADVLRSIAPEPANPARDMYAVIDWVHKNLKYSHDKASLQADADFAFTHRGGHCSDYHGLCATMGRALGFPTRMTYGWTLVPKNSPSHCRMEAYLPPYGWVSFDVAETQQLLKKIESDAKLDDRAKKELDGLARDRLLKGFRENCWLLLTRGRDYQLEPKAAAPVTIVRTAYIEADGEALPEPDPANTKERAFSWMTVHNYTADRPFAQPFKDYGTLKPSSK